FGLRYRHERRHDRIRRIRRTPGNRRRRTVPPCERRCLAGPGATRHRRIDPPAESGIGAGAMTLGRELEIGKEILLASNNQGKIREFTEMLTPLGYRVRAQGDLQVEEAEEPHATFVENALAKARHAARATGLACLADDSGICANV